jgi:hypothetical protein
MNQGQGRGQPKGGQQRGGTPKPQANVVRGNTGQTAEQRQYLQEKLQQQQQKIMQAKLAQAQGQQKQPIVQPPTQQHIERGKKQDALAKSDLSNIAQNIKFVDHTLWSGKEDAGVIPTIIFNTCKKEIFTPKQGLKTLEKKLKTEFNTIM